MIFQVIFRCKDGKYGYKECPKCGSRMDAEGTEYGSKWWQCKKCQHRIEVEA